VFNDIGFFLFHSSYYPSSPSKQYFPHLSHIYRFDISYICQAKHHLPKKHTSFRTCINLFMWKLQTFNHFPGVVKIPGHNIKFGYNILKQRSNAINGLNGILNSHFKVTILDATCNNVILLPHIRVFGST